VLQTFSNTCFYSSPPASSHHCSDSAEESAQNDGNLLIMS